jgi:hypothetical protein
VWQKRKILVVAHMSYTSYQTYAGCRQVSFLDMSRTNLTPPAGDVVELFENACKELGLKAHRAESEEHVRWHLTVSRQKGTLEANWSPTNHTLWLEVKPLRRTEWMPPVIEALKKKF